MKNKINLKKIFTVRNVIYFLILLLIFLMVVTPVNYYITIGGGTMNLDDDIKVSGESVSKGSINATYVNSLKGTVFFYLLSYVVPSFDREKVSDSIYKDETVEDSLFREKLYFNSSISNATFVAYSKANKKIAVKNSSLYVLYVDSFASTSLKARDKIVSIDGNDVFDSASFKSIINGYDEGAIINIRVLRDKKLVDTKTTVKLIDNEKKIGVYILNDYEYDVSPKIEFDFSGKQSGSSGGLMLSLSIYNKLVPNDITKGYKVCGTGTIDKDGNVGEIGGVKYKLRGANRKNCDIFFVPVDNYKEVSDIISKKNYSFKVYKVSTFDETLGVLNDL